MRGSFSPKERAIAIDQARDDLYFYSRWMMLQQRGIKWLRAQHHRVICDALTKVFRGEIKRLIINLPPRYSKTQLVENFVSWSLGHAPDSEFIYTSYSATLAEKNSWDTRDIVAHDAYQEIFPDVKLRRDSQARVHWRTLQGGVVYAAGAGGTITGFGAGKERPGFGGAILIDDPHKPDEATSEGVREGVITWFQNTLESRRNSADTPIVLIMQRLHERDLAGWLLDGGNGEKWEHVCCPAITAEGDALWPEKHTLEDLMRMQAANAYVFAGQFMQVPRPEGGAFFNVDSLFVDGKPFGQLPKSDHVFMVVDTAMRDGAEHDGTACITFAAYKHGRAGNVRLIIVDYDILQINAELLIDWLPGKIREAQEFSNFVGSSYGFQGAWIEDAASGIVLLGEARRRGLPVEGIDTKLTSIGKEGRALAVSSYVASGQVKISQYAYDKTLTYRGMNKNHLLDQIATFRIGMRKREHNLDLIDCFAYGISLALGDSEGW